MNSKQLALVACGLSVTVAIVLAILHTTLGGPGDQVDNYEQAADLFPFVNNYYGPLYFLALRIVKTVTGLEWFTVGKLVSLLAGLAVLLAVNRFLADAVRVQGRWAALTLVAVNPVFIGEMYSTMTIMFGVAVLFPGVLLLMRASTPADFARSGLLFGVAALARYQANGFFLGALLGTAFLPLTVRGRMGRGLGLALGFLTPVLLWKLLLLIVQGYAPANYNFIHLTIALGEFRGFEEVPSLIERYGSILGVVTSDISAVPRILLFGFKQVLLFPFREGFAIAFLPAGLLIAGVANPKIVDFLKAPWFWAFSVGLLLTGVGSRGWLHYYLPFVPFCALLIQVAIAQLGRGDERVWQRLWVAAILVTVPWSARQIASEFSTRNWTEWAQVREYLHESTPRDAVVSSTAASLRYQLDRRFIDHSLLFTDAQVDSLTAVLRGHGITHLVVTERHTLFEFPSLGPLLQDPEGRSPPGLRVALEIHEPRRAVVFEVLSDD